MADYQEGYTKLLTYKQGMEIYQRTKRFTTSYLDSFRDGRLVSHMNDSARSVPSNIREGAKRGNTKAYLEFLGFARGSLEELKGDYEELKRELEEGERWNNKDKKGYIRNNRDREGYGKNDKDREGYRRNDKEKEGDRVYIEEEIKRLLDLVYGEDCMLGRQIRSLEGKALRDKALPQSQIIKRGWERARAADKKFWDIAKEKFGIEKDEKGIIRRKKE